jgi:hypothetical protein
VTVCVQPMVNGGCNSSLYPFLYPGQATNVRAYATAASGTDLSASCSFQWGATLPNVVTIVPSSDATHRDALITRISSQAVSVTATCGGKVGLFSP